MSVTSGSLRVKFLLGCHTDLSLICYMTVGSLFHYWMKMDLFCLCSVLKQGD